MEQTNHKVWSWTANHLCFDSILWSKEGLSPADSKFKMKQKLKLLQSHLRPTHQSFLETLVFYVIVRLPREKKKTRNMHDPENMPNTWKYRLGKCCTVCITGVCSFLSILIYLKIVFITICVCIVHMCAGRLACECTSGGQTPLFYCSCSSYFFFLRSHFPWTMTRLTGHWATGIPDSASTAPGLRTCITTSSFYVSAGNQIRFSCLCNEHLLISTGESWGTLPSSPSTGHNLWALLAWV